MLSQTTFNKGNKNDVLNMLKGLACIAVVFIHVHFPGIVGIVIWRSLSSFAVPAFLMISGYFAYAQNETVIKRRLYKIVKIFLFGYICFLGYNFIIHIVYGDFIEWISSNFIYSTPIKYVVFCTIEFANVLWYLIALIETYFVWYFIVKNKKENVCVRAIPLLLIFDVALTTYCETTNLPWMYKINFLAKAMPYFLFGYYLHSKEAFFKSIRYSTILFVMFAGCVVSVIPMVLSFPLKISCVGNLFYSLAIFTLAIKIPNKSYCKPLEYVGEKLSLNVYIFHLLIYSTISILFSRHFLDIDIHMGLLGWILPLFVVLITMIFAQVLDKLFCFFSNRR